MGRKRKAPKIMLTLEQQLDAMGPRPTWPEIAEPWMGDHVQPLIASMIAWDDKRYELKRAIVARDAKKLRDPGRSASGNFDPSPYVARGGKVEPVAKELRASPDSQYPKRVVPKKRSIDRLLAEGTITKPEWQGAATLLWYWAMAEGSTRMVAAYEPDAIRGAADPDAGAIKRIDAVSEYRAARRAVPYHALGVVTWVVINDGELSDWAAVRGFSSRHSRRLGAKRLSQGLRALAARWGY